MGHFVGHHIQRIRYQGIFDLEGLFKMIYKWLDERGYEVREVKLKHKVPKPAGINQEVWWEAFITETDYVTMWVKLRFFFYEMNDVEVVKEGKKKLLTKGRLSIEIESYLELDWQSRWETSIFLRHFRTFYEKRVINHEIEDVYWDKNYYNTYKLHTKIKEHLDFETKTNAYGDVW